MVREDFKARSQVKVVSECNGKRYHLRTYRFNCIPEPIEIPYCSWANLDCCGGWSFDEEYLDTAVQKDLKLFAGRSTLLKGLYTPNFPTRAEVHQRFNAFIDTLPDGVVAGIEPMPVDTRYFNTFICRTGRITDYVNLDTVFSFYMKLGYNISPAVVREVESLCGYEIERYGTDRAPFDYANADTDAEFITTGLLLGYPIESTVSILQGY